MKFFWSKYPAVLKLLYPQRISRINESGSIYLTFDDGPVPEVTPWVLDQLKKYNAKASFFCIGENVRKHPEIFKRIQAEGHCIGNHTNNHLKGWDTPASDYIENINLAENSLNDIGKEKKKEQKPNSQLQTPNYKLFRPPYGKITNSQARLAVKAGYKIVMWEVLSGDYDDELSPEKCFSNIIKNSAGGSTIVFHDSIKAEKNLRKILPQVLEYYKKRDYKFRSLKDVL